jgi:hypothetical protein
MASTNCRTVSTAAAGWSSRIAHVRQCIFNAKGVRRKDAKENDSFGFRFVAACPHQDPQALLSNLFSLRL